ncbi:hydrolase, alpha/beta domain protein [Dictyocaulus viviparus]|uniref:Hydrolase, alpha/beta domain protein n=1 Tax=Dictyocaulus viviparus TaxID=29172 RepID=A0A0D8Y2M7_DICVI|nr:hydrolase, alpha/beta domain protein [Dictyocaulus viviparus]
MSSLNSLKTLSVASHKMSLLVAFRSLKFWLTTISRLLQNGPRLYLSIIEEVTHITIMDPGGCHLKNWFPFERWSIRKLEEAEYRIFANFGADVISRFVPVRFKCSLIYTVTVEAKEARTYDEPVVLMHGFGAGVAVWGANIAELAKHHDVHAFDLLGFGRSSRPRFHSDPVIAELEMVESIDDWRLSMGIRKMYIVAHSFGAYLATAYAIQHPQCVKHLILVDPWGFPEKVEQTNKQFTTYSWMGVIGSILSRFNPLATLRFAGPYGPAMVKKLRPDLGTRYKSANPDDIYEYLYQCNAQSPTGETAFKSMTLPFGWARRPMIKRFHKIDNLVPVTFLYGSRSWIDPSPAFDIKSKRDGYTDVKIIQGAGHHVYADVPIAFNEVVLSIVSDEEISESEVESNSSRDSCESDCSCGMDGTQ